MRQAQVLEGFKGKSVLITGNTGFQGTWLHLLLLRLGATVFGLARKADETLPQPNFKQLIADMTDAQALNTAFAHAQPDFVFHLAAQSLPSGGQADPVGTIATNVIGTTNLLECLRNIQKPCAVVVASTYSCYENKDWYWGYRETDPSAGNDIYGGSKAAAELLVQAYHNQFFSQSGLVNIATARTSNVIGGGDFAISRLIPDCYRAWRAGQPIGIKSPTSQHQWLYVLDVVCGYAGLAQALAARPALGGQSFNFAPANGSLTTVIDLVTVFGQHWGAAGPKVLVEVLGNSTPSTKAIKLNGDKAASLLSWKPAVAVEEGLRQTAEWYISYIKSPTNAVAKSQEQIEHYLSRL